MDSGDKDLVAVVIPIYKQNLSANEKISLQQALKVFTKYQLIFICPNSLKVQEYKEQTVNHKITYFEKFSDHFFQSITGYSQLLLSRDFYKRFDQFKYMLIYQLDGFVFRDELKEWCEKGFDYVGAPWFTNFAPYHHGNDLSAVGNGGVSLRKIDSCIKLLNSRRLYRSPKEVFKKYYKGRYELADFMKNIPLVIFESMGYQNNARHFIKTFSENEDHVWGIHSSWILPEFKVAPVNQALRFAFECDPTHLYKLNGNKLPFCCHAWEKWDLDFWRPFIENEGYKLHEKKKH